MREAYFDQAFDDFGMVHDLVELLEDPDRLKRLAKFVKMVQEEDDDGPFDE